MTGGPSRWLGGLLLGLALGGPLAGQAPPAGPLPGEPAAAEPAAEPAAAEPAAAGSVPSEQTPDFPPRFEVVPRVIALEEEAAAARREIASLQDLEDLAAAAGKLAEREEALQGRFELLPRDHVLSGDQISQLRLRAERDRLRLDALLGTVSERYQTLEELRGAWLSHQRFFAAWRRQLEAEAGGPALGGELSRAGERSEEVLGELREAALSLASLQRRVQGLVQSNRALREEIERLGDEWEDRLRNRTVPSLVSPAFALGLREAVAGELVPNLRSAARIDGGFLADNANLIALQLLLLAAIALGARRLRPLMRERGEEEAGRWRGLLSHPWAVGAFTSVVIAGPYYEPAPGGWRLLLAAGLAGSISLIAHSTFSRRGRRRAVYLLAAIYLLFQAGEALGLPTSLYRLLLLALCLAPLPLLLLQAAREIRAAGASTHFAITLRTAAVALALVAVAELAGYHVLARWLLESATETTFLIFVVTFLIRLVRKLLRRLFTGTWVERSAFWQRVGEELAQRLGRVVEGLLIVAGSFWAIALWDVADSPGRIWETATRASLRLGPLELSLGQALLGLLAVYLSVVVSWLLRALVDTQLTPKHQLEKGVGDTIKVLLHYTLVVVGFLLALSFLGIPVQSFAIVAGALGVGIGFGLQDVVNNFLSGLILLFERPVRVGDTVVVEGQWGQIQRIGLRSTVIQTFDRSELIVPNGKLISQTVTNWTLSNRVARAVIPVGVAYGSDYGRVLAILEEVCRANESVLEEPPPLAVLTAFADSAVSFEVRAWIDDIDHRLRVHSALLQEIARRFQQEGIEIPFPQRDLHLRSGGDLPSPGQILR